jgi:anti-anti-sigma factor
MNFNATLNKENDTAKIMLSGELDATTVSMFKEKIEDAARQKPKSLILIMKDLSYISSAGLRVLIFAKQKMGKNTDISIACANSLVTDTIKKTGFHHSIKILE